MLVFVPPDATACLGCGSDAPCVECAECGAQVEPAQTLEVITLQVMVRVEEER